MLKKKVSFMQQLEQNWPHTKKELDKAVKNAEIMLKKGEKYLKEVSNKTAKEAKKLSLSLKKEKLYYDLGRAVAKTSPGRWKDSKKITSLIKIIKGLDKQIKNVK